GTPTQTFVPPPPSTGGRGHPGPVAGPAPGGRRPVGPAGPDTGSGRVVPPRSHEGAPPVTPPRPTAAPASPPPGGPPHRPPPPPVPGPPQRPGRPSAPLGPRGPARPPSGGAPVPGGRPRGGAGSRPGAGGHARPPVPAPVGTAPLPRLGPPGAGPGPATGSQPVVGARGRWRGARSELRRQLREHKRVRATAMAMVIALLVGAPLIHLGIQTAARDPVLNSLAALPVPEWAAESPEDRIIGGSRWCLMDCRFRERRLVSQRGPDETYEVYRTALLAAGWVPWQVEGCPLVEV